MESLFDNRPLLYSLAGAGGFVVMLALGKKLTIASSKYLYHFFVRVVTRVQQSVQHCRLLWWVQISFNTGQWQVKEVHLGSQMDGVKVLDAFLLQMAYQNCKNTFWPLISFKRGGENEEGAERGKLHWIFFNTWNILQIWGTFIIHGQLFNLYWRTIGPWNLLWFSTIVN